MPNAARSLLLLGVLAALAAVAPSSAEARVDEAPALPTPAPTPPGTPTYAAAHGGALVLDRDALVAYVADADNEALHRVDLTTGTVVTTPLGCAPQEILLLAADRVAVSMRGCNEVRVLDIDAAGEGSLAARASVPTEPWGLALSPRGDLLVTSAYGRALTALAADTLAARFSLPIGREPRGVTVTPDGRRAFVTHAVGDALTVVDLAGGSSGEAPTARAVHALGDAYRNHVDEAVGAGTLHPSSSLAYVAVFNETGSRLFIPHLAVQNGQEAVRTVSVGYGGVSIEEDTTVPSVAVIDVARERPLAATREHAPKDFVRIAAGFTAPAVAPAGSSARQPRAGAVVGDSLLVVSGGTNELVELDARSLDPALAQRRVFSVGDGPEGVDVDPRTGVAAVWNQRSHDVSVVSLGSGVVDQLPVAGDPLREQLARGRRLFHAERDRRISRDGRACASCHPEGREDGLVWRLGQGPRQTLALAGRLEDGPYGWHGVAKTLEGNIDETIHRLGGSGLPPEDLAALVAYLREGLRPPARSAPSSAEQPMIERGRALFMSAQTGCNDCHTLDHGSSDRAVHDVGSRAKTDEMAAFRTPPLTMLEATAPYFHDGRYPTLEAMLDDNLDRMGQTSQMNPEDRAALLAFLRTL